MRIILFSLLQARSVLFTGELIERLRLFKFSVLIGCQIPSMRIGGFFHYAWNVLLSVTSPKFKLAPGNTKRALRFTEGKNYTTFWWPCFTNLPNTVIACSIWFPFLPNLSLLSLRQNIKHKNNTKSCPIKIEGILQLISLELWCRPEIPLSRS